MTWWNSIPCLTLQQYLDILLLDLQIKGKDWHIGYINIQGMNNWLEKMKIWSSNVNNALLFGFKKLNDILSNDICIDGYGTPIKNN